MYSAGNVACVDWLVWEFLNIWIGWIYVGLGKLFNFQIWATNVYWVCVGKLDYVGMHQALIGLDFVEPC